MRQTLGAHNARLGAIRSLLTKDGRQEQGAYAVEGPTLLRDALDAGVDLRYVVATAAAFGRYPELERAERLGVEMLAVDDRTFARLSDLESPTGILAAVPLKTASVRDVLDGPGPVLLLADLNDPGNAGTLLRAAAAFGIPAVIAGNAGADCFGPKAVRAAMGATFSIRIAVAAPEELGEARAAGWSVVGLRAEAPAFGEMPPADPGRTILAVGHERHGLGRWQPLCASFASLRMRGKMDSLNAAMAGTLALYELTRGAPGSGAAGLPGRPL